MVTNTLRLLNLTKKVQSLLVSKQLEVGHAKVLLVFKPEEQYEMALTIIKKMTVRTAEKFAQSKKQANSLPKNH
jgi:ParB family chromosome partitioning protein